MGKTYTKTLVETTAAMSLIPKLAGVLANHRQIDLLVVEQGSDFTFRIAVDAKHYSTPIDVKDVDQFCGVTTSRRNLPVEFRMYRRQSGDAC